ncbi:hypothetical protein [Novosphingobium kaempferiae]|uniref:hypothetical protein n=1 Tax=Novosphingobium kaempferiae TaxID=2896849 RepID=UPI001E50D15F|nr:hypothetical protein [Novosphingobium kaempferiae]
MVRWHETLAAQLGLRFGGLAILSLAWLAGSALYGRVHAHPPAQASLTELALCAVFVLLLVIGNALLFVGPGLWKQVPLPGHWSGALIEPRQFDVLLHRDHAARIDAEQSVAR